MKEYYLGLDIGTASVGYAVTNETYDLLKFKGEPVWGVTTFEEASASAERRAARTARRRYDRRQQRVQLVSELFAPEICKIDPNFFIRRKESALFAEDTVSGVKLFDGGITDREYHQKYPTIHHLICDLMTSDEPHDIRLVYLAVSWLVANRGHFLFDVSVDEVGKLMNFSEPYNLLRDYLADMSAVMPWDDAVEPETVLEIMQMKTGSGRKQEAFKTRIYGGKAPSKKQEGEFPFNRNEIVKLLCGAVSKPKDLFFKEEYAEQKSINLSMGDEEFAAVVAELGEDGELLTKLRAMYDCSMLISSIGAGKTVSAAKVEVYEQHKKDLRYLKDFLRKYKPKAFSPMFRLPGEDNYVAYSYHVKSCKNPKAVKDKAKKQEFTDYLKKVVKGIAVEEEDRERYEDMMNRLELQTFLPKQKDTDNRVIPMQLYHYELKEILCHAAYYLPLLSQKDETGLTVAEKLLSIFTFRIPYFVGPLNPASTHAWLERKAGKIYPWNFEQMVDMDASEEKFIRRMTNKCTYWPGKDVLPVNSLLYERFTVLNTINNLKVNGKPIPIADKQDIFRGCFMEQNKTVTLSAIQKYLVSRGAMEKTDELSGVDVTYKGRLKSFHAFKQFMADGKLTELQVEEIIKHAAYSEDRLRMERWLQREYPALTQNDRKNILRLKLKEFGRLSGEFLNELVGVNKETGEAGTILEMLWNTHDNLMQLLSERYSFREQLNELSEAYYAAERVTLSKRLEEMYISNAVKRPIIRTLDVTADVVKAMGCAPKKIFVEMARGGTQEQKGKRAESRKQQLLALYKYIKTEDARRLTQELEAMGEMADNRLQSDKLYLYYMQMGKCMYSGEPIDLTSLFSKRYNIDHIYPRCFVKDDSVLNNKVLVASTINGTKDDRYPIEESIRQSQRGLWEALHKAKLLTDEKFHRLTRDYGFREEEKQQFINRQLVETRQSTKAVAQLLHEKYPDAEIVYVKAGLVSEFRQEFGMLKCRSVNDLHHTKDAYLNIVAGNVYSEKFTKKWFNIHEQYTLNTKPLYTHPVICGGKTIWQGEQDLAKVKKIVNQKNNIHIVQYPYCRHSGQNGGLFDQNLLKAREGLIPRKSGKGNEVFMDTAKYGGYDNATASFFVLVRCRIEKKNDLMVLPINLIDRDRFNSSEEDARLCVTQIAEQITGKAVKDINFPLGRRIMKINTLMTLDGFPIIITGKGNGGRVIWIAPMAQLILDYDCVRYIKYLESFKEKFSQNREIILDYEHDHISAEKNIAVYHLLLEKMQNPFFSKMPSSPIDKLRKGEKLFETLSLIEQIDVILNVLRLLHRNSGGADFSKVGGTSKSGAKTLSACLSNWKKKYCDVRIVDMSASGLYVSKSQNLLELL